MRKRHFRSNGEYLVDCTATRNGTLPCRTEKVLYQYPVHEVYGNLTDPFVRTQAMMSLAETPFAPIALFASYRRNITLALLMAFTTSAPTGAKTALIFVLEYISGFAHTGTWSCFISCRTSRGSWSR